MYDNNSIQELVKRVGWQQPTPPTSITITTENNESLSGRYFNGFNSMATVESVNSAMINKEADNDELNKLLSNLRFEGVMQVLTDVYNLNTRATAKVTNNVISLNYMIDYSTVIVSKAFLFDEVIGLSTSIKTLQLLISTLRSNGNTVSNKYNYEQLMQYLEGSFTVEGRLISKGLLARYKETIGKLIEVLFPLKYPDGYVVDENGNVKVPTLRGRRVW